MSRNPVYASTAGLARHFRTLPELLIAYSSVGIDHIELGWAPSLGGLSLPLDLASFHANWLVHNYFPAPAQPFVLNIASQDAAVLQRSRDFAAAAIRLSAALGAPFYSVHCGFLAEFDPSSLGRQLSYGEIYDYEPGYSTFLSSLKLLLTEARTAGIRLLIEPNVVAPRNLIDGRNLLLLMAEPKEFSRLLSDLSDENLGILLDLGHLKVTSATLAFSEGDFIDAVAPAVGAFHVHDNDGISDQHRPIAPDSWTLDILRQPRFNGSPVIIEAKFDSALAMSEHCVWLKNLLNH